VGGRTFEGGVIAGHYSKFIEIHAVKGTCLQQDMTKHKHNSTTVRTQCVFRKAIRVQIKWSQFACVVISLCTIFNS